MIGFLGYEGSYTYYAACKITRKENLVPYNNIGRLFYALDNNEVNSIIVPFENMKEGTSFDVLGRIRKQHFHISREIILDIVLNVVSGNMDAKSITKIYATDHSINECYNTLKEHYGKYQKVFVKTDQIAYSKLLEDNKHTGAVLSSYEQLNSLNIVSNNIRDTKENIHKYVEITKTLRVNGVHNHTLISVIPKLNRVGALYDILHEFVLRGVNITKLLSIPTNNIKDEIIFYIDLEGNIEDKQITDALGIVKYKAKGVTLLGSYYTKT